MAAHGTTLITLLVPPGSTANASKLLVSEQAAAKNIKSSATRNAVLAALKVLKQRVTAYAPAVPAPGVALFAGEVDDRMVCVELHANELPAPLGKLHYRCDVCFDVRALEEMAGEQDAARPTQAVVVMDGTGALVATVRGTRTTVVARATANLPNKHHNGGSSAKRFAHLRLEQRLLYRRAVEALVAKHLIDPHTARPIVDKIVIAGSAGFKRELELDTRLAPLVVAVVDVAYGGAQGLREALTKAGPALLAADQAAELEQLRRFFAQLDKGTERHFYGPRELLSALERGAVHTLLLARGHHEALRFVRLASGACHVVPADAVAALGTTVVDEPLFAYATAQLAPGAVTLVGAESAEGSMFVHGFGGIGGVLLFPRQYAIDEATAPESSSADDSDSEFA